MEGFEAATYGDRFAAVYDDWYPATPDTDAAVTRLAALASMPEQEPTSVGVLMELGVGTGTVALPLAGLGFDVRGVDASEAMLAQLHARDPEGLVATAVADFTRLTIGTIPRRSTDGEGPAVVRLVFVTANTLLVVPGREARVHLFRAIAEILRPSGGRFVFEAFVPPTDDGPDAPDEPDSAVSIRTITADCVVLCAARRDRPSGTITGQFIELGHGQPIRLLPFHLHVAGPEELDGELAEAGLLLEGRTEDWSGTAFTPASNNHVSVYVTVT